MDSTTFLTIAIPTFNRADILDISLGILIPQLIPYSDSIELIVSDNCSTDHTQAIIKKYQQKSDRIKFTSNAQTENTGYFGNFVKCKQLSKGDYFWLLSDNEHLSADAIEVLFDIMKSKQHCSAFFIDNFANDIKNLNNKKSKVQFADDFFNSEAAYMSTLISSVIFKNDKTKDDFLFSRFSENLFIGFIMFCNVLTSKDLICTINFTAFYSYPSRVSFDVFKAWSLDIIECVDFMTEKKLLDKITKETFMSGYIKTNLFGHVLLYRKGTSVGLISEDLRELQIKLDEEYLTNESYIRYVRPILYSSKYRFYLFLVRRRTLRIYNKYFKL